MRSFTQIYFLGIGGIGMSALARYFHAKNYKVSGYDKTPTVITDALQTEGIEITFDEEVQSIPDVYLNKTQTLVVITPAIPETHPQLQYFINQNFTIQKRAQVLGDITHNNKGICIAGTHGKTTTSTMTAHLLYQSKVSCNAFLGGISNNYNTNLLLSSESNLVVVEADEYDRSFHQLSPFMAVITSVDPDHLDIYGSENEFNHGFEHFVSLIRPGGALLIKKGIDIQLNLAKGVKKFTYSMNDGGDFYAENITIKDNEIFFDFVTPTDKINNLILKIPALINVENSVAAMAIAWLNGVTKDEIRFGISSYSGIYRRFNIVYKSKKTIYIDDYAHHPSELKASILSLRNLYPDRHLTGIFQPHLYTRTRDFAKGFAEALSMLDELIILDIYPARELPIEGVDSNLILKDVTIGQKSLCSMEKLIPLLKEKQLDVVATFGAGDIDKMVHPIIELLKNQENIN